MELICSRCGGLLIPKKKGEKTKLVCRSCGYSVYQKNFKFEEKIKKIKKSGLVKEEGKPEATIDAVCPKCGHEGALYWTLQTRSPDEPQTEFFRCTECGHTWRRY